MRSPQRINIIHLLLTALLVLCYFPKIALGLEINTAIKNHFQSQIERREKFIDSVNSSVKHYLKQQDKLITKLSLGGIQFFEGKTGIDTQNKLYQGIKNHVLKDIGFKLGGIKGLGNLATKTLSLAGWLDTSPARAITLAYNIKEKPKEYFHKGMSSVKNCAVAFLNLPSILTGAYLNWQRFESEAIKDPLSLGKSCGELTVYGYSLYLIGGQTKTLSTAHKLQKATVPKASLDELAPLIKNNKRLPMDEGVVRTVAEMSGVKLNGVKIKIKNKTRFNNNGEILATTSRFSKKITFYKGAFRNWEKLSFAVGHEAEHLSQLNSYRNKLIKTNLQSLFSKKEASKYQELLNKLEDAASSTHEKWVRNFIKSFEEYTKSKPRV